MNSSVFVKVSIVLAYLVCSFSLPAQTWQWAKQSGSAGWDGSSAIVSDPDGNMYVAGSFKGLSCYFNTDTLTCRGANDVFVVKYSSTGEELWVRQLGGWNSPENRELIRGLDFNASQNCLYITGSSWGAPDNCSVGVPGNGLDVFISKLDPEGNCVWTKMAGGLGKDENRGCVSDEEGNLFLCGMNEYEAIFGGIMVPRGGFLAKYDPDGNCIWAKNKFRYLHYLISEVQPMALKMADSDIIYVGTAVNDTVKVDTITKILTSMVATVCIGRFDHAGNAEWINCVGGPLWNSGFSAGVDHIGNVYFTGIMEETETIKAGSSDAGSGYFSDSFVGKVDDRGNLNWVRFATASGGACGYGVSVDSFGYSYYTGFFSGTADFGSNRIIATTAEDMFVARYDPDGNCLGAANFGPGYGADVCCEKDGTFDLCGGFSNTIKIGETTMTSYGDRDVFVTKGTALTGVHPSEENTSGQLLIYANPTTGLCNITIPDELKNEKNLTLFVYDQSGKLVQKTSVEMTDGKIRLDIRARAKGTYQAILTNGEKRYSGKIVFE